MDPAQNNTASDNNVTQVPSVPVASSGIGHEREVPISASPEVVSEITQEVELSKEVERVGVEVLKDTIELPPDVKKLGVTPSGPSAQVTTTSFPQVTLPLSDDQVVAGLHAQILSSLRWLAVWCIKKLKKAHIALRQIHGKIIRVKS